MINLKLVGQGWGNLKKIWNDGVDGLGAVFKPSHGDIINQVKAVGGGGSTATVLVDTAKTTLPEIIPDSWSKYTKYAKYALVGGAALLAYSVLKK